MMKNTKRTLTIILVLSLMVSLVGCGGQSAPATTAPTAPTESNAPTESASVDEKIILRIGSVNNSTFPMVVALNEVFKPRVEELTNNRVEVQIFDNAQLGGERDLMEQTQLGTLEMTHISPVLGAVEPKMNILDLPYLFLDEDHLDLFIDGELADILLEDLPSKGLRALGFYENGVRHTTTKDKPINSLNDIKGLSIRTPEAPVAVSIFKSLGANVTTISFNELYSALQQGVVDGQENSYNTIASSNLHEVQGYVAETGHQIGSHAVIVSEVWWKTLPTDIQEAIALAVKESSVYQREIFREMTDVNKQKVVDGGMIVTEVNVAEFSEAVKPVYEDFYKQYPDYKELIEEIRNLK